AHREVHAGARLGRPLVVDDVLAAVQASPVAVPIVHGALVLAGLAVDADLVGPLGELGADGGSLGRRLSRSRRGLDGRSVLAVVAPGTGNTLGALDTLLALGALGTDRTGRALPAGQANHAD